jgi:acetyl esterase/lipase
MVGGRGAKLINGGDMNAKTPFFLLIAVSVALTAAPNALAQALEYDVQRGLAYGQHDGAKLTGDLYSPKAPGKYPALVAAHGGGWQVGNAGVYRYWGPYLAQRGYVLFSVDYRLVRDGKKMYPEAVHDVRAAVQFLRSRGEAIKVDPGRIGLIGDSAGAHLAALVALAGDGPQFAGVYKDDPYATVSTKVKVCIGIYGVYNMAAQWEHDLLHRPFDNISEKFLGASLVENRRIFFEASPLSYVTRDNRQTSFLLTWGTEDDIVDRKTQSDAFLLALKHAGFFVRPVIVQGSPHFWAADPIEEANSFSGFLAPRLLRFLQDRL